MFILGNLLIALAQVINMLLTIILGLILVRAVLSWFSPDPYNPLVQLVVRTTDPMLRPLRKLRMFRGMGVDLTPVILAVILVFLQSFAVTSLAEIGVKLKMGSL